MVTVGIIPVVRGHPRPAHENVDPSVQRGREIEFDALVTEAEL
jgi:hypothetical protein